MDIFEFEELLMKQFNVIDDLDTILKATDEDLSDDANVDALMNMIIGVRALTVARISDTMDAFDAFAGDYHRCAKDRDECVSKLQNDEFITEVMQVDTDDESRQPSLDRLKQAAESYRTYMEIKHNTDACDDDMHVATGDELRKNGDIFSSFMQPAMEAVKMKHGHNSDALNSSTVADFIDAEEDESDEDVQWYNDFRKNRGNQ